MSEIKDRVLTRRKLLGFTQAQLDKKVGVKQQSIPQLEECLVKRPRYLLELSDALRCTVSWLVTGDGPAPDLPDAGGRGYESLHKPPEEIISVGEPVGPYVKERFPRGLQKDKGGLSGPDELEFFGHMDAWDSDTPLHEDEVELPLFREVELAAGAGATQVVENNGCKLRFAKSTLSRAGVPAESAACAFVRGNSMEPMMPDGTCVGVNTADKTIRDGKVYAVDHEGMLRVKLLYRRPGGGLKVVSLNSQEHPPEEYPLEEAENSIEVIGRVFWYSAML